MSANRLSNNYWVQIPFFLGPKHVEKLEKVVKAMEAPSTSEGIRQIIGKFIKNPVFPKSTLSEKADYRKASEGRKTVKVNLEPETARSLNDLCEEYSCERTQLFVEALEREEHELKKAGKLKG